MESSAMAELMVKLERDCEQAEVAGVPQFHIRSEWQGENKIYLAEVNELNIYFNRKYKGYAITIVANNGFLDGAETNGTVLILVAHQVINTSLTDIFDQLYQHAPRHLK